jgi:hypothetical protein
MEMRAEESDRFVAQQLLLHSAAAPIFAVANYKIKTVS